MRWRIRLLFAILSGIAIAVVAADSSSLFAEKPSFTSWSYYPAVLIVAVFVVGVGATFNALESAVDRRRAIRRETINGIVSRQLFPIWVKLQKRAVTPDARTTFGVQVWLVPTWHWRLIPRWLRELTPVKLRERLPTPQLWRAGSFRVKRSATSTDIAFTRDIGLPGKCWRLRDTATFDAVGEWGPTLLAEAAWNSMPVASRMGLNYAQYQRVRSKFAAARAVPILRANSAGSRPEFMGCVVVDSSADAPDFDVSHPKVDAALLAVAQQIASQLSPIS